MFQEQPRDGSATRHSGSLAARRSAFRVQHHLAATTLTSIFPHTQVPQLPGVLSIRAAGRGHAFAVAVIATTTISARWPGADAEIVAPANSFTLLDLPIGCSWEGRQFRLHLLRCHGHGYGRTADGRSSFHH